MISINLGYKASHYPICSSMVYEEPRIESYIQHITDESFSFANDITVEVSDMVKKLNYRISLREIIGDLEDIFDTIDDLGDYPQRYGYARELFDQIRRCFGDRRNEGYDNYEDSDNYSDGDIKGSIGRIVDIMSGQDGNGWADWAKEAGYPDLSGKIKRVIGKYRAWCALVAVEYFEGSRTIMLYRRALGEPNNKGTEDDWMAAFAVGLFHAFHADMRTNVIDSTLLLSLSSFFKHGFWTDVIGDGGKAYRLYNEWRSADMKYWPYSGALYLTDIKILHTYEPDFFLFRRLFKRSLKDAKGAFEDLKAAYRLYEGHDFRSAAKATSSGGSMERYAFNGGLFTKGELAQAIVEKYIIDHPGVMSADLIAEFNSAREIVITKSDLIAKLTAGVVKNYQYSFEPKYMVSAADEDCAVYKHWTRDTIRIILDKAKALGYTVTIA